MERELELEPVKEKGMGILRELGRERVLALERGRERVLALGRVQVRVRGRIRNIEGRE
ncbi:hypothetical protein HYR82_02935 [Candidatus Peregrinibacteria bacterium]|nr:hypothetical protein [Candidatus Peregrinibacteria bacterium]